MSDHRYVMPDLEEVIAAEVRRITEEADRRIEAGVVDDIVAALRAKGWTCIPPAEPSPDCPRGIPGCPLPAGHEHYSRTDEEIRAARDAR